MLSSRLGGDNSRYILETSGSCLNCSAPKLTAACEPGNCGKSPTRIWLLSSFDSSGIKTSRSPITFVLHARTYLLLASASVIWVVGRLSALPLLRITLHLPQVPSPPHRALINKSPLYAESRIVLPFSISTVTSSGRK